MFYINNYFNLITLQHQLVLPWLLQWPKTWESVIFKLLFNCKHQFLFSAIFFKKSSWYVTLTYNISHWMHSVHTLVAGTGTHRVVGGSQKVGKLVPFERHHNTGGGRGCIHHVIVQSPLWTSYGISTWLSNLITLTILNFYNIAVNFIYHAIFYTK